MTPSLEKTPLLGLLVATLLSASVATADPADTPAARRAPPPVRIEPATAPAGFGARTRDALRDAVERALPEDAPGAAHGLAVVPTLVQLRRYVGPEDRTPTTICIVDLVLKDDQSALVGSVRGRASVQNGSMKEALVAAADVAARRLPQAVLALERARAAPAYATR